MGIVGCVGVSEAIAKRRGNGGAVRQEGRRR